VTDFAFCLPAKPSAACGGARPLAAWASRSRMLDCRGDGLLVEFGSVVDAVRCAVAFQQGMISRNRDLAEEHRILFNLGDVVVEGADLLRRRGQRGVSPRRIGCRRRHLYFRSSL
jgi:hypothetical protein